MNRYLYIFAAFVLITVAIFVAFRFTTGDHSSQAEPIAAAPAVSKTAEEVIVKKDEDLVKKRQQLLKDTSGDYYLGKDMAPVILVEYASLSCPHCAHFHDEVVAPLTPTYIDSGKVKYVFRDFPLNAPAFAASKAAHCAGTGDKFFSFIKVFFKSQEQWVDENYLSTLKSISKLGGISEEEFNKCQADKALEEKILKKQKDAAEILEVRSTPTIFINGVEYQGKNTYEEVAKQIDAVLKGE